MLFPTVTFAFFLVIVLPASWLLMPRQTIWRPFMVLSFLALSVIPSLKLTDRGLVDVEAWELVPVGV